MQPPRGTRDFGPSEMAVRRRMEERLRRVLHTFHYGEVQTPTFEDFELFEKKAGPGIREEIYAFKDKGERDLCLRPELTLPVMRFYFGSELKTRPKPLRLFYLGPCYRYDRPQEGRYREFWQLGAEVIGDATPEAHAELLWLALTLFREAGLEGIVLRVGHLGVLRSLIEGMLGVPTADQGPLMRLIDKKDIDGIKGALKGRADDRVVEAFLSFFDLTTLEAARGAFSGTARTQGAYDHVAGVFRRLRDFGADSAKIRFDPTIARGLEYYSGLVFELDCPALGAERQLLGGGEYDLSAVFQATPVPCVGFGLGFDRTLVALEKTGALPPLAHGVDVVVACLSADAAPTAQRVANQLRDRDLCVELDLAGKGPKKALAWASQIGSRTAVLVGARELERGVVTVKNLASGEQVEETNAALPGRIETWLRTPTA